jgi:hypothetical protein
MSAHFSKFSLNTYPGTDYFQAHAPADYPLSLVLQKCRAFRRLPPNLKELAARSRRWARRVHPEDYRQAEIDRWYDAQGYELDPGTGRRLTDAEIDADWERWEVPDIEVTDIPVPEGGFADPATWEPPPPAVEDEPDPDEGISEAQLLSDIASHGREYVAKEYGVPADRLAQVGSDLDLAKLIRGVVG